MNLLNEEIRCLKTTIAEKKKMMNAVKNINLKENLRLEIMVLQIILDEKLTSTEALEEGDFIESDYFRGWK